MAEVNWQEKYVEFQMLQQQLEKIGEHVSLLQQQEAELDISQKAITEFGKTSLQNEILVPIADGIFFKAELLENQNFLVHVGSDTVVEHRAENVLKLLEKQQEEIKLRRGEAEIIMQQVQEQMAEIYRLIGK